MPSARVLVLFAHPALEKSRVHSRLAAGARDVPGVTFHDLYEVYPDGCVDVTAEQALLRAHDEIVMQFSFYWYSTPSLLKEWQDVVLEYGWAYGRGGRALRGKTLTLAFSTGGGPKSYGPEGHNRYTLREFLRPLEQTAALCGMAFRPPWVIPAALALRLDDCDAAATRYARFLRGLADGTLDLTGIPADAENLLDHLPDLR